MTPAEVSAARDAFVRCGCSDMCGPVPRCALCGTEESLGVKVVQGDLQRFGLGNGVVFAICADCVAKPGAYDRVNDDIASMLVTEAEV